MMYRQWLLFLGLIVGLSVGTANAQLLPNNNSLNAQSVERWMQSNRAMAPVMQLLDGLNPTAEALATFDQLPVAEQDQQINNFLSQKHMLDAANRIANSYGWKSVGEYMRLSTRLGNAIAAYFLTSDLAKLPEDQAQRLRETSDPAILAVPDTDIAFIRVNEQPLQQYIQAYAAGRDNGN